jgi:hypothetical protein
MGDLVHVIRAIAFIPILPAHSLVGWDDYDLALDLGVGVDELRVVGAE